MYTTLKFLKANDACKDGYRQMISFFGMSAKMKERKLPLSLCALVLSKDNLRWLLDNALIIEPEEFKAFRRRWLPSLSLATLWGKNPPSKDDPAFEAFLEFASADSSEKVEVALEKYRYIAYAEFANAHQVHLYDPVMFLQSTLNHYDDSSHYRHGEFYRKNKSSIKPDDSYFPGVSHMAYLFSFDPYGDAVKFIAGNKEVLPLSKTHLKLEVSEDKPKAVFTLTGAELVFNTYRFVSNKNTTAALTAALNDELNDEEGLVTALGEEVGGEPEQFDSDEQEIDTATEVARTDMNAAASVPAPQTMHLAA